MELARKHLASQSETGGKRKRFVQDYSKMLKTSSANDEDEDENEDNEDRDV